MMGELLSMIDPTGNEYWYHYDHIGNTLALTDTNGSVVNRYAYEPFGRLAGQGETVSNPFKYVGQWGVMEEGNNLYYMRARYYDAGLGRFITRDPIGLLGGVNPYGYVGNNPVNFIDPSGLWLETFWDVGNVVWDIVTGDWESLPWDMGAAAVPLVPAGTTKACKAVQRLERHHVTPQYLGGGGGDIVRIPRDYHQGITNAWRGEFKYGQGWRQLLNDPTFQKDLKKAMEKIYRKYPLPKY